MRNSLAPYRLARYIPYKMPKTAPRVWTTPRVRLKTSVPDLQLELMFMTGALRAHPVTVPVLTV